MEGFIAVRRRDQAVAAPKMNFFSERTARFMNLPKHNPFGKTRSDQRSVLPISILSVISTLTKTNCVQCCK